MKISKLLLTAAAATMGLGSCSKSGSGDTTNPTNSSMQFQLKADNPMVVVNKTDAPGSILWTSGSASATQVKLEAKQGVNELEFKKTQLQQIDLFASVSVGLGNVVIPVGTYTEVEFKIDLNQNGSSPSMELNGTYTSGTGTVTPVVFTLNGLFQLKAEQNNVVITSNSSFTALTTLNLAFVSNGITQTMMNSATVSTGKINISASSNTNLYNMIVTNLQNFHHIDVSHH